MPQAPLPGQQSLLMSAKNGLLVSVPTEKIQNWEVAQADSSPEALERRKKTSELIMRHLDALRSQAEQRRCASSLPFSQEPSKIPEDVFRNRYLAEKDKFPFLPVYMGKNNPYENTAIETEADYDRYLREHTYHILCEEATIRSVRQHDELLRKEKEELAQKLSAASDLILSMDDRFKQETSRLHDEFDSLMAKHEKDGISYKRTRRLLLLAVAVLLIFSALSCFGVISFDPRTPARTYDQGYAAGQAAQESQDAGLYDSGQAAGYQSGFAKGKDEGYNDGYYKGYWEGYADAGDRSSGSGSSRSSGTSTHTGTGSSRDTPIANTYIGNKNSKKFHKPTCSYLPDQNNQVTFSSRDAAISAGYTPCSHCNP